jgi:hypothetical protein
MNAYRIRTLSRTKAWASALLAGLVLSPALGSTRADAVEPAATGGTVRVAASGRYKVTRTHRFVAGGGYRELWEAEIELPLLDLATEAGGLTPTRRFGGLQTAVLAFENPEGRSFSFRGTDKDPSAVLPAELQDTMIRTLVQDMMAAQHPGGPLVAGVICDAAGVLTIHERMVVMPDDPALGEFREDFAGMVGTFFEYPLPKSGKRAGFHGASEIIDQEELYERLASGHEDQVAVGAFLRARLVDILIGDFDRHRKQWRWARLPGDPRWQPIPEDRDQAFVRYDGVGPRAAAVYIPILQNYGPKYPSMKGLAYHGWEQDRWLLPALSWEDWERIATDVQSRITDDAIDAAIAAMPREYQELDGERLRQDLRGRRDRLLEAAHTFYEHLARQVDIQATDAAEAVTVSRDADGATLVEIRAAEPADPSAPPLYSRRFEPQDTRDLRIHLRDGDDRVTVTGKPGCIRLTLPGKPGCIRLRLIAGDGRKLIDDSQGGGTRIYDAGDAVQVVSGPGTKIVDRPYEAPEPAQTFVDVEDVPARDWGSNLVPYPMLGYQKDVGVFIGAGVVYTRHGFRKHPWSSRHDLSAGYATEANKPRFRYTGRFRFEDPRLVSILDLYASGIEVMRFYGFGNETSDDGSDKFYRARTAQVGAAPALQFTFPDDRFRLSGGPWIEWSDTKDGDRLINVLDPYGTGSFGMIGAFATAQFDSRRTLSDLDTTLVLPFHENPAAGYPTSGFLVDLLAEVSPPVWDVESTWGAIEGAISAYLTPGDQRRLTLAARVGGRQTFGTVPYLKAAYIGGSESFDRSASVRGLRAQRFAGDASVYGNLDLRLFLIRTKLLIPTDVGVFGFADVGRVFLDGEDSNEWHPSAGGGIWLAPLARANTISLTVAASDEETMFYMMFGFLF